MVSVSSSKAQHLSCPTPGAQPGHLRSLRLRDAAGSGADSTFFFSGTLFWSQFSGVAAEGESYSFRGGKNAAEQTDRQRMVLGGTEQQSYSSPAGLPRTRRVA